MNPLSRQPPFRLNYILCCEVEVTTTCYTYMDGPQPLLYFRWTVISVSFL